MNPPFQHTVEVGTASRSGPVRRHPGLAPRGGTEVISRWCGPSLGMQAALPGLGGVGSALWGHEEPSVHLEKERAWIAERPRPTPCPPAGPLIAETTQPARRVPAGSCPSPGILEGGSRSTPETSPSGRSCLISLLARRLGGPSPTPEVAGLSEAPRSEDHAACVSWSLYPVLLWTDVPDCCFAESLDHREVQHVTPLPWQGPTSFSLRGFQPGDRLLETESRLCSAPRGWPGRRLQLTSLGLRSAGARRSTRQVSGPGSCTECVPSTEKGPGSREALRRGRPGGSIFAGDVTVDARNMLQMKLRRGLGFSLQRRWAPRGPRRPRDPQLRVPFQSFCRRA